MRATIHNSDGEENKININGAGQQNSQSHRKSHKDVRMEE